MLSRAASSIRAALLAGGLVLAPLGITIWVFGSLVGLADRAIMLLPDWIQPEALFGFPIPGLGVLLTLLGVGLVGGAMRSFAGRRVVSLYEQVLGRVPILSSVYNGLKQLFETVFSQKGKHFREVVLVEYPRVGIWGLGFIISDSAFLHAGKGEGQPPLLSVFLPTTPNPTSGFYLLIPENELWHVDLTVEEAFKLIMSAGIVNPSGLRAVERLDLHRARLAQPVQ